MVASPCMRKLHKRLCVRDLAISLVLLVLLVRSFGADAEPCVHSPLRMFA
jgi:hypothetical protein